MGKRTDYENYMTPEQMKHEHDQQDAHFAALIEEVDGSVLDVGAGIGTLASKLFKNGYPYSVRSVDVKPNYVEYMERKGLYAECGDICSLDFEARQFDTVVASEVLEHMENPGQALAECCRVAKKRVVFTLPRSLRDDWHLWTAKWKETEFGICIVLERDDE